MLSAILAAASDNYRMAGGSGDFYFGHISYTEAKSDGNDPTIRREGAVVPEPATLNTPVGPGDVIRTTDARRCEVQFDSGTIVRLDVNTELKIETILAGSLSADTGLSNLTLGTGRVYVMFKKYDDREMFQVMTPNAAVKLKHDSVAVIAVPGDGPTEVRVKAGKASVLFGIDVTHSKTRTVKKLGRLVVLADGRFEESGYPADTAFETWNEGINANFLELHKGLSPLPKPVRKLPRAVFDFAQRFGNTNGEWLWDDLYGYVWRPFLNDGRYPWGNWSPYVYGRWAEVGNSMFWVPEEPWGWVPYHLGLWQWDRKHGWVWLPGSLFAPAWAAWDFFEGYFAWRPWTLFDWYFQGGSLGLAYASGFYSQGGTWYYDGHEDFTMPDHVTPPLTRIRKDQLKKGEAPGVPIPKEMKKAYGNVVTAMGRKDGRLIESLKGVPDRFVFVARGDLNAGRLHDKVLTWDKVRAG
ncbi:MAG TPA: FecR family protein, partial [Acidobacteriota bacterium]|nr:FecR family protein [Acidobacteriota bacterium]